MTKSSSLSSLPLSFSDQSAVAHRYRGLLTPQFLSIEITWGGVQTIDVPAGALIQIANIDGTGPLFLTGLAPQDAQFSCKDLALCTLPQSEIPSARLDMRRIKAIAQTRNIDLTQARGVTLFETGSAVPGEVFVTKATQATTLFAGAPLSPDYLVSGGGSHFQITIQPGTSAQPLLPPPLGKVIDEFRIPRASAKAYTLQKGQFVQIIDVEGQQCSDFMALRNSALERGLERPIDSTVSRTKARSAYPLPGLHDKFYDADIKPLLAVRQDTVGRHDTFALACTANGYEERGFPGHINCSDNISEAFAPYGIAPRAAWPAINFFFNSWIDPHHHNLASDEAWSRPGDYVVMEALDDLTCVSTACPDDVDPINGWNPTDVHVRIYSPESSITHAVAWRAQPEDASKMTTHSAFHPRTSKLAQSFHAARDLWMPAHYDATGAIAEYWACRQAATLQDMSGLRKFDIVGPDAEALLQHCLTRNVAKLSQFRGLYALMCDETGAVLDDGTLFRLEPMAFRWLCGSEESALHMREEAERLGLKVAIRSLGSNMANLAIQGPKSREILLKLAHTTPAKPSLEALKWFGFTVARIGGPEGPAAMICRSGFTGELGYEIFCDQSDALTIWDDLMEAGEPLGLKPMGGTALDMLRIEAGLMTAGAEFGATSGVEADALEAGLGFAIDFKKGDFLGRDALERNKGAERKRLVGLLIPGAEPPHPGDAVFDGRRQVGVVTSACHSPELGQAIAMARIAVEAAETGSELEIGKLDNHIKRMPATVTTLPFIDPKREKARA
ncbi:MAG: DUF1989 domain-containing protein [Pseudomonadota bacterium]